MNRTFFPNKNALNSASSLLPSEQSEHLLRDSRSLSSHPVREISFLSVFCRAKYRTTGFVVEPGKNSIPILPLDPPNNEFQYSFSPSPVTWGITLLMGTPEPDDYLHNPDSRRDKKKDLEETIFTARGASNLGCLTFLCLGCLMLL
jgi:hypothetical protein